MLDSEGIIDLSMEGPFMGGSFSTSYFLFLLIMDLLSLSLFVTDLEPLGPSPNDVELLKFVLENPVASSYVGGSPEGL